MILILAIKPGMLVTSTSAASSHVCRNKHGSLQGCIITVTPCHTSFDLASDTKIFHSIENSAIRRKDELETEIKNAEKEAKDVTEKGDIQERDCWRAEEQQLRRKKQ